MPNQGRTFFNRAVPKTYPGVIPQISFKLFGQWDEAMTLLKNIGPKVKASSIKAQLKIGKDIVTKVRAHIRNQDLGWPELDPKYAMRKMKAGLSDEMLMAYNTYHDNISIWTSGNNKLISIGVRKGIYTRELNGRRSKLDVATIAAIHEFSSGRRSKRRPLWNPTIMEMGGAKGIKTMFLNSLVYHLKVSGINVTRKENTVTMNNQRVTL